VRISLIYPLLSKSRNLVDENKQYWPPLGLAYIAAVLRDNGHLVQILDRDYIMRKNNFDFDKTDEVTIELLENFNTQIVGFSATTPNVSDVKSFSEKIKRMNPKITTVIGGPHCIGEQVTTLKMCSGIDMLVSGEGEMAMLEIANGLSAEKIGGLTYKRRDGTVVSNPDRPLIESLDSLPFPARDLLDMDFYTRPSRFISRNLSLRTTHIFTARGCPYNCYYCAGPLMGKRKVRFHSPQRVVSEIEELIQKYSVEAIYFAEDMFLSNKKRALQLARLFIERGIHKKIVWMAQVSTNAVDEELLSVMKEAGCVHVEYGFESGSQRVLDLMNKRAKVERNKDVAFLTRKSGLRFQGNFIVGYPRETEDDFNKTLSFIKQTRPNNVSLNLFMPLPGTEIYRRLKQKGQLQSNWDDLGNPEAPYINYADMPASRFAELFFKAKLRVVLPINLMHFVKDNMCHPIRLLYVVSTQFKSVLSRMVKAIVELRKISKKRTKEKTKILFITYHTASNPLMESQGFSYIKELAKRGIGYFLLTYETKDTLASSKTCIQQLGIPCKWKYLYYHRRPRFLAKFLDIVCGIILVSYLLNRYKLNIIHARGVISGIVALLPAKLFRVKLFFDSRGLLADKYVGGGLLKYNSLNYKLLRWGEDIILKSSDYFTVETHKHAEIIRETQNGLSKKMDVIPCCVDLKRFDYSLYPYQFNTQEKFELIYVGKIGTWYLIKEMFNFFKVLTESIQNAYFTFLTQDDPAYLYSIAREKEIDVEKIKVKKPAINDIPILLAEAHAGIFFINPYKRYNSSPIKYGEYLASGLPVIINSGIGDTDTITEEERVGVVLRELTIEEYKRAVECFVSLLNDSERLRLRCRKVAEKYFSLNEGIEKYFNIYMKLSG
jgi:anaerobic magnesium-protoporphyrin IX monomethyl ester cyclase